MGALQVTYIWESLAMIAVGLDTCQESLQLRPMEGRVRTSECTLLRQNFYRVTNTIFEPGGPPRNRSLEFLVSHIWKG